MPIDFGLTFTEFRSLVCLRDWFGKPTWTSFFGLFFYVVGIVWGTVENDHSVFVFPSKILSCSSCWNGNWLHWNVWNPTKEITTRESFESSEIELKENLQTTLFFQSPTINKRYRNRLSRFTHVGQITKYNESESMSDWTVSFEGNIAEKSSYNVARTIPVGVETVLVTICV